MSDTGEKCDRCGSVGSDRRTLWHACLYALEELGLPFEQVMLWAVDPGAVTTTTERVPYTSRSYSSDTQTWTESAGEYDRKVHAANGPAGQRHFYALRVCKRCRAEWMRAVKEWFERTPEGQDHDADERQPGCGSGIFVRREGAILEITREEWDWLNPGREPCVVREPEDRGHA